MVAEVVTLYETNYRDVPATLRHVADLVEGGEFGNVSDVAFVIHADSGVEIFQSGDGDAGTACILFQAALQKIIMGVLNA